LNVVDGDKDKFPSVPIQAEPLVSSHCPGLKDYKFFIFFFHGLFNSLCMHDFILFFSICDFFYVLES
jgi:hypothetical protein